MASNPAAPIRARHQLARHLKVGVSAADTEIVLLVAYELCTNAVEHAHTPLELTLSFDGQMVVIEVHDESNLQPRLQPFNVKAARGPV
jgi:anti-sigma regulatory factor (Ser/Thr protein kinase)